MFLDPETNEKFCPRCAEDLPPSAFGRDRSWPDGLTAYCRPCKRAVETARYATHPERLEQIRLAARRRAARRAGVEG